MSYSFSEQIKIFREDYVSVVIYRNVRDDEVYYDIVVSRLIWRKQRDGRRKRVWQRGANLKPTDLPKVQRLLAEAQELLGDPDAMAELSAQDLDVKALM